MTRSYEDTIEHLVAKEVAPWVVKLPWQDTHPVSFDGSEGYKGAGVFGARTGPIDSISFKNVAHEMAHAIEIMECGRVSALSQDGWGLRVKSTVNIAGIDYEEPMSMQATEREARVCGIQLRILEIVEHPGLMGFASRQATILAKFMPDWVFGGSTEKERHASRARLIEESHRQWPAARVAAAWRAAQPHILQAALLAEPPGATFPMRSLRRAGR